MRSCCNPQAQLYGASTKPLHMLAGKVPEIDSEIRMVGATLEKQAKDEAFASSSNHGHKRKSEEPCSPPDIINWRPGQAVFSLFLLRPRE